MTHPDPTHNADYAAPGAIVIQADARSLPVPDESVDLIVTSPPYWTLRSYRDRGEHIADQIGSEATVQEFIDSLLTATQEMMRVLRPSGSIWINLGDKYGPGKSLMGLPWRYAIGCTDRLGLILRAEVIWAKTNGLPDGARDRVGRRHEQWFHLTRRPDYFAALDEIREPYTDTRKAARRITGQHGGGDLTTHKIDPAGKAALLRRSIGDHEPKDPRGKLPGSVWTVPTEMLAVPEHLGVEHFALFPTAWPARLISGWCPAAGVVLDPFGGTGTTAMMAMALGRYGINVDICADYCRLAEWRIFESGGGAKGVAKARARGLIAAPALSPDWAPGSLFTEEGVA